MCKAQRSLQCCASSLSFSNSEAMPPNFFKGEETFYSFDEVSPPKVEKFEYFLSKD